MTVFQETIPTRIDNDFSEFLIIINSNLDMNSCQSEQISYIKVFHKSIYIYKEIINELSLNDFESSLFYDSLNGLMECLICIIQGKYKLSSMAIRGSMETYAKALVSMIHGDSTNNFTNNIELGLSKVVKSICDSESLSFRDNKDFKKTINRLYTERLKEEYWSLSDIVHSRTTEFNSNCQFLQDVLTPQFVKETFNSLLTKANLILEYFIDVLIISHYKYLDSKMNFYIFTYIIQSRSCDFLDVRKVYI